MATRSPPVFPSQDTLYLSRFPTLCFLSQRIDFFLSCMDYRNQGYYCQSHPLDSDHSNWDEKTDEHVRTTHFKNPVAHQYLMSALGSCVHSPSLSFVKQQFREEGPDTVGNGGTEAVWARVDLNRLKVKVEAFSGKYTAAWTNTPSRPTSVPPNDCHNRT